jgi:rhodanese-related sulfurtransferase
MPRQILSLLLLLIAGTAIAQNDYKEISLPGLMKKKQEGDKNMVVVDVRTNGEYYDSSSRNKQSNIGRIKGAIHVELRNLIEKPDEALKQLETYKDKDIYLICSHSYRSRTASNILLKNGFTHVTNVNGGMTEWFRRYDELTPYMNTFYETGIGYKNVSAGQVVKDLLNGKNPLMMAISSTPRFFWDSANKKAYEYYPHLKNAVYFNYEDSLKVLDLVQKEKSRPIVLFSVVNNGAAELADWLTKKGFTNVSFMIGGNTYFYEYVMNNQLKSKAAKFLTWNNRIEFVTSVNYCKEMNGKNTVQVVDPRNDTLFNKVADGIKYPYSHLDGSVNFFADKGEEQFIEQFTDKQKEYVLMSQDGITGLALADALAKRGYKIYWLMGGIWRLEWYTINMEDFGCKNILVK